MPGQSRQDADCNSSSTPNKGSETAVAAIVRLYDSRVATAQEIGHSGSLGSNAGGHAPSRALGLSRTRKTCLQPCSEAPSATVRCCASSTHARLQILISNPPKFSNPAFLVFPVYSYSQRTVENPRTLPAPSYCLGAMNSNKIFAPLGQPRAPL